MVRLKEDEDLPFFIADEVFQFHYGTIKRQAVRSWLAEQEDFNSTMVRLKELQDGGKLYKVIHFNSTMVRLKEMFPVANKFLCEISIPLWYD